MENNMEGVVDDIKERFVRAEHQKSKDPTQEEGSQDQAMNDGQDVGSPVSGISSNPTTGTSSMATNTNTVSPNTSQQETLASMSTNVAGTGTKTDASSSIGQEKNKNSTATFNAGTKIDASSSLGQEHNKTSTETSSTGTEIDTLSFPGQENKNTSTSTSGFGTKTDASSSLDQEKNKTSTETSSAGTEIDTLSFPDQEQDKTSTKTSSAGTKIDASSSRSQEKNMTSTTTSDTGTKIDTSSIPGQELNKTSTETSSAGTKSDASSSLSQEKNKTSAGNDNASCSRTSEEQRQIRKPVSEIVEEPPELGTRAGTSRSYTLIDTILHETEIIRSMAVDINDVLFTGSDTMIRKWHRGLQVSNFESFKGTCYSIAAKEMRYPEPCVFVAHNMGEITVWARRIDGLLISQWTLHRQWNFYFPWNKPRNYPISCLCLSDDFNFIYAGSADCTLNMWHARIYDNSPINTITGHTSPINALAVGLSVVFSGSSDGIIKMWRRETYGRNESRNDVEVRHLSIATFYAYGAVPAAVNALVFCTVDNVHGCLYAGSSDGNVRCWKNLSVDEPEAGNRVLEVMSSHKGAVTCLAWCSGPFVFSGSRDKTIRVWRRAENEAVNHTDAMVLRGHTDGITCIACQNDWEVENAAGPRQWILYSGSLDGTLRIWRVYEQPRVIMGGGEIA